MADVLTRRRFTVDEYYRMAEAGILSADERVELIEGEIVTMTPIGPVHAGSVPFSRSTWNRSGGSSSFHCSSDFTISGLTEASFGA